MTDLTVDKLKEVVKDPDLLVVVKAYLIAKVMKEQREQERDEWYVHALANEFELHISPEWQELHEKRGGGNRIATGTRIVEEKHVYLANFEDPVYKALHAAAEAHWRELGYLDNIDGDDPTYELWNLFILAKHELIKLSWELIHGGEAPGLYGKNEEKWIDLVCSMVVQANNLKTEELLKEVGL